MINQAHIFILQVDLLHFSWRVGPDLCGSNQFPIILVNDGPPSLEFQHLCSTRLNLSATNDSDDPMSLVFLKEFAEELSLRLFQCQNVLINHGFLIFVKMQSKSETGLSRGSNVNQPRVTWKPIALLGLRLAEISDTVRKHVREIMSPIWIPKHRLNLYGIVSAKSMERNPVTLFIMCLLMIEMSHLMVT